MFCTAGLLTHCNFPQSLFGLLIVKKLNLWLIFIWCTWLSRLGHHYELSYLDLKYNRTTKMWVCKGFHKLWQTLYSFYLRRVTPLTLKRRCTFTLKEKNHTPENKEINFVTAAFHPAEHSQEIESFLKTRVQFVEL